MVVLLAALGLLASLAFFAELFLFGALSGATGPRGRRGDRFVRWLGRTSNRMDRLKSSAYATAYRWARNTIAVVVVTIVAWCAIVVVRIFVSPPQPSGPDPTASFAEAIGHVVFESIILAMVPIILLAGLIAIVLIGIGILAGVYALQVILFGFKDGRPVAGTVLEFMGRHVMAILAVTAAVGAVAGIASFVALIVL